MAMSRWRSMTMMASLLNMPRPATRMMTLIVMPEEMRRTREDLEPDFSLSLPGAHVVLQCLLHVGGHARASLLS
jgi:hypothetical protein